MNNIQYEIVFIIVILIIYIVCTYNITLDFSIKRLYTVINNANGGSYYGYD